MLDTNICIYIVKNNPKKVTKKFNEHKIGDLAISSICVLELYCGVYKSQYIEKNLKILEEFLSPLKVLSFGVNASIEYGKIKADLERKGNIIGGNDIFIAAHAKSLNATLITNNTAEFLRVDGLKVENWV